MTKALHAGFWWAGVLIYPVNQHLRICMNAKPANAFVKAHRQGTPSKGFIIWARRGNKRAEVLDCSECLSMMLSDVCIMQFSSP